MLLPTPTSPEMRDTLRSGKTILNGPFAQRRDHLTFLTTRTGKPYAGDNFSEQFRAWCKAARLSEECSFHGLRKAACRRLAEAGCSVNEIAAVSGHATLREVQRYTKAVDQERMARSAMARQANDSATASVKS